MCFHVLSELGLMFVFSVREDTHKKNFFFSCRTTKVLPPPPPNGLVVHAKAGGPAYYVLHSQKVLPFAFFLTYQAFKNWEGIVSQTNLLVNGNMFLQNGKMFLVNGKPFFR